MTAVMQSNVVLLTAGLSGSSVLTGLIAQAGYWLGHDTAKKPGYDTYENRELTELNRRLFRELDYSGNYSMVYDPADVELFKRAPERSDIDLGPYRQFIEDCNAHQPWVWKDPRLWLTIYFWEQLMDFADTRFLVLTREPWQNWVSTTIKRQIQTPGYCRRYNEEITGVIIEYLENRGLEYRKLLYEDLLVRPEETIEALNDFLGTSLGLGDLQRIYNGRLYRRARTPADFVKAALIYGKNYRERYR